MDIIQQLLKKLNRIEKELERCRGTVQVDGWQTMRYAKKMRKWDMLGQEKLEILIKLNDLGYDNK